MIDWHSHILPRMDDGCKDEAESLELLRMLSAQNVDSVILTPHFYANDESVESFIERRNSSFDSLAKQLSGDLPSLYCGAEVRYYSGISRMADLSRLTIGESKLLLMEMPFSVWSSLITTIIPVIRFARETASDTRFIGGKSIII